MPEPPPHFRIHGLFASFIERSNLWRLPELLTANWPNILLYHRCHESDNPRVIPPRCFEKQMQILHRYYTVLPLNEVCGSILSGEVLPPHSAVLTFDDCYADVYTHIFPILRSYKLPATLFAVSDFIDRKIWLWPDTIEFILRHSPHRTIGLGSSENRSACNLDSPIDRDMAFEYFANHCLPLSPLDRTRYISDLAHDLDVDLPLAPPKQYAAISWDQLRALSKSGITVGSHSSTHPVLTTVVDQESLRYEIESSKHRIETEIDKAVEYFAYPQGRASDFSPHIKGQILQAGYIGALTAIPASPLTRSGDFFEIGRIPSETDTLEFLKAVSGLRQLRRLGLL
jgi:peptidoglycan/xylan/chitin deacetylase (PgdA/CDA1 family)